MGATKSRCSDWDTTSLLTQLKHERQELVHSRFAAWEQRAIIEIETELERRGVRQA